MHQENHKAKAYNKYTKGTDKSKHTTDYYQFTKESCKRERKKNKRTIKVDRKQENGISKSLSLSKYSKCDELSNQKKLELLDRKK